MRTPFTADDWKTLPEGFRAQLIDGFLVKDGAPTYRHGRVATRIIARLIDLVGPDRVPLAPSDVHVDRLNVFQPDIVVLDALPEDDSNDVGVPLMAFEVLPPSTRKRDRGVKTIRLLGLGVAEVWLIDPVAKTIECRDTRHPRGVEGDEVIRSEVLPGFSLCPNQLFSPPQSR